MRRLHPLALLFGPAAACSDPPLICGDGTQEVSGVCEASSPVGHADGGDGVDGSDGGSDGIDGTDGAAGTDGTHDSGLPDPTVDVYLLGGQSNMVGFGQTISLPPSLRVAQSDAFIYWSGRPEWVGLQASSDVGTRYFGPEVTLGRALADAHPDRRVYLVKHAVSGTALGDFWYPGEAPDDGLAGEGYRVWHQTVEDALAALEADGLEPRVRGMVWMQGESDASRPDYAAAYAANLTHLIARVREDTGVVDLPFVAAQVDCRGGCDAHRDEVNAAIEAVAEADPAVATFPTEDLLRYPADVWHYQGPGVRSMGQRFAARLLDEELPPLPQPAVVLSGTYEWSYSGSYTVGWRLSLSEDVVVTDLGQFDLGLDGLAHGTTVALWEAETRSLVAQADIPAAVTELAPWVGNFVYAGLEPVLLPAGDYIIGVQSYADWPDYYVYNAQITESAPVTWVEARHEWSTTLAYPTQVVEGSTEGAAWFGPNFLWTPAPDPAR